MQIHHVQHKIQSLNGNIGKDGELHKYGKSTKYFFLKLFLHFVFTFFGSNVLVFVAQITGSYKSYGCVDDKHANQIFKEP